MGFSNIEFQAIPTGHTAGRKQCRIFSAESISWRQKLPEPVRRQVTNPYVAFTRFTVNLQIIAHSHFKNSQENNPRMKSLELKIVPPFQVLILGAIMWLIHRYVPFLHHHSGHEFSVSRWILWFCLAIFLSALYQFWKHKTTVNPRKLGETSSLITNGIFAISRNPIYVVDVLLLLAWAIWLGQWINLIWPIVFILYVTRFQIEPEERILKHKFGDAYETYQRKTRRWV